jgi:hypothetical protein
MAELAALTPYFLGLLATAVAWLFKTVIQQGKDTVALQTAFKFYMESKAQGAAKVLDSPNPTPPEIRVLLRRYYNGESTETENKELRAWLKTMIDDPSCPKSERSAAMDILAAMKSISMLPKRGWLSRLWH